MAVRAVPVEAPEGVPRCKHGHAQIGQNVVYDAGGRDGKVRARCRVCKRDSVRRAQHRRQLGLRFTESLEPRLSLRGGHVIEVSAFRTQPLFSLIPKPMRDRVAGVLMDERVDLLQRRVLKRCADQRAWAATNPDVAARMYIEALIAQTLDARSSLLRIDSLMNLIFG